MKHGFFSKRLFAAVATTVALALAGCADDRGEGARPGETSRNIIFSPAVESAEQSRATSDPSGSLIESNDNIPDQGAFGVYAYSDISGTKAVFSPLQNMRVKNESGTFGYSPVADWPEQSGAELSFFGYYPWQDQGTTPATGDPVIAVTRGAATSPSLTIDYTCPVDPAKQVDLMWAYTGFTGGFDPVEMVFGHALTRISFKGAVKDYQDDVVITGITLRNVKTKGRLAVSDAGVAAWSNLSTTGTMALTTTNGLRDGYALTATQTSLINSYASELLVIPQEVEDVVVEVTATLDGEPFDEAFVFPLADSPNWEMNQGVTYEIVIEGDGTMKIEAKVAGWSRKNVGVIYDGPYFLELSHDRFDFHKEGGTTTLTVKTNYDKINPLSGYPGSYLYDEKGDTDNWINITYEEDDQSESGGVYTREMLVVTEPGTVSKAGSFVIGAGNMNYVFHLTRSGDSWLTASPETYFYDGKMHNFSVQASVDWTVAIKSGNTTASGNTPMTMLLTQSGKAGTGKVNFTVFDGDTALIENATVTLAFTDLTGVNTPADVEVPIKYTIAPRFARSNIVLYIDDDENRILTFAEKAADHTSKTVAYDKKAGGKGSFTLDGTSAPQLTANVQGIHFRWGGLVGLSSSCEAGGETPFDGTSDIKFWPVEYEETHDPMPGTWKFNINTWEWEDTDQVPYMGDDTITGTDDTINAFIDRYDGIDSKNYGYDAENGYGDICRYISDKGWVEGDWRMPTIREFHFLRDESQIITETIFQNGVGFGSSGTWSYKVENPLDAYPGYYGFTSVNDARMVGAGITLSDPVDHPEYLYTPAGFRVVLPAVGSLYYHTGNLSTGDANNYWSSTPYDAIYGQIFYVRSYVNNTYNLHRTFGCAIRCIREFKK